MSVAEAFKLKAHHCYFRSWFPLKFFSEIRWIVRKFGDVNISLTRLLNMRSFSGWEDFFSAWSDLFRGIFSCFEKDDQHRKKSYTCTYYRADKPIREVWKILHDYMITRKTCIFLVTQPIKMAGVQRYTHQINHS